MLHVGDAKDGGEPCSDALLRRRFELFQGFRTGFVFTPGDNDWTDCHRRSNGGYLPVERLDFVRELFYPVPDRTTGGAPFEVTTQADDPGFESFVENTLFVREQIVFAQIHVVGSNNGLAPWQQIDPEDSVESPRPDRIAEFVDRNAAAIAWLDRAFDTAAAIEAAGVHIAIHANPRFELAADDPARAGFNGFLARLSTRAAAFDRPVLLAHGDFHTFLLDQPRFTPAQARTDDADAQAEAPLPRLMRVQTFGETGIHWLRIEVDPDSREVFTVVPRWVEQNLIAPEGPAAR